MNNLHKFLISTGVLLSAFFVTLGEALAVCPICMMAVGAGVGVSRWLGISDAIMSLWIGAFLATFAGLLMNKLAKFFSFKGAKELLLLAFYVLALFTLRMTGLIGIPGNTILGIDRVIFGIIIGTIMFVVAIYLHETIKNKRGKVLFPFQKVIIPLSMLILTSFIMYAFNI